MVIKVFVSWSGELSKEIAQSLKKWLPSINQSVKVFYSSDDIQKGENWSNRISKELKECKYGIVCLTPENITAPWLHFEAGALTSQLDSCVTALMINIKTSDIQGPLSQYQATQLDKESFYQLIKSIGDRIPKKDDEESIEEDAIQRSFENAWEGMYEEITQIVSKYKSLPSSNISIEKQNDPIEEILQLSRKQNASLASFEQSIQLILDIINRHLITTKDDDKECDGYLESLIQDKRKQRISDIYREYLTGVYYPQNNQNKK